MNIEVIELHISNKCTYKCRICAKDYGGDNQSLADWRYINKIIENLTRNDDKKITCGVLQTGGCGDAFLNKEYINFLIELRKKLPKQKICLYSNFSLCNENIIDKLVSLKLLDQIQVRIDSLNPELYKYSTTNGDINKVLNNARYFFKVNDNIEFTLIYFPLYKYTNAVKNKLNKEPTYFKENEAKYLKDEWVEMQKVFNDMQKKKPELFKKRISGICYWAERKDCQVNTKEVCRHLPEKEGTFNKIVQIYPNGNIGLCAYDSLQNTFIYGNIFEKPLYDIWNSKEKQDLIQRIRQGDFYGKHPCINPLACHFDC